VPDAEAKTGKTPAVRKGRPQPRHGYFVPCPAGLEPVLLEELRALHLEGAQAEAGGARFSGTPEDCYRANLWLRTGVRVLRVLEEFPCHDEAALYRAAYKIEWEHLMGVEQTLAVRVVLGRQGHNPALNHSQFLSRRIKDAIVDRFREVFGKRPNVDPEQPDLPVHAFIDQDRCTLSLDSSGSPLFMRGYRRVGGPAPLKETLAAGLLGLVGWRGERPFYDFCCGSGTLPIEAALIAGNRAPGLLRERFGFQSWPDFQPATYKAVRDGARAAARPVPCAIHGSDSDPAAIQSARDNARRAGVTDAISFAVTELADFQPAAGPGLAVVNPPYGERVGERESLKPFYKLIGDVLKQRCKGMEAFVFTAQSELIKSIGLKTSRRTILFNGPIECRLLKFGMY
jgi:putative N6-adenine-specific DNA methylase